MKKIFQFCLVFFCLVQGMTAAAQCTAVSISSQPSNQTVTSGGSTSFTVSVNGTAPFSYFWYKNGSFFSSTTTSSFSSNILNVGPVSSSNNGDTYYCIVTNCTNTYQAISNTATLTVGSPCNPVSISSQPLNQTVTSGGSTSFSVSVNGTAPFSYFWYKNGSFLSSTTTSSLSSNTLNVGPVSTANNGDTYYCLITNCTNTYQAQSNTATLTVGSPCTAVSMLTQPTNQTVTSGGITSFTVAVNGTAPFSYFWYKNGSFLSSTTTSSLSSNTLNVGPVSIANNGDTYYCLITNCTNTYQAQSTTATLTVTSACTGATITTQPTNQSATTGNMATFSVIANGTAPITYQWYKNSSLISGAISATYTTPALTISDNGNTYYCKVTNCSGVTNINSNSATLTVTSSCTGATITSQPSNQISTTGNFATFNVLASGTAPITYQWYKNSTLIVGANSASYTTPALTIGDNGNSYYCNVTNCSGSTSVNSNSATLTVTSSCTGAIITTQPTSQNTTTGNTATFNAIANGTAPITYQWYKNSSLISGANSSSYTTPNLTIADNGNTYYCNIINCSGATNVNSNSATLTVTNSSSTDPNLIIASPQVSNSNPVAGNITMVTFLLKNTGTSSASASYVSIHLSTDNVFQSGTDLFLDDTLSFIIAASSSQLISIPISIPQGTSAGTWYILISADGMYSVIESDETDNTSFIGINVSTCYDNSIDKYALNTNYYGSGDPAYLDCVGDIFTNSYDIDNWNFYKYQCTSYTAFMVNQSWGYNFPNKKFDNNNPVPVLSHAKFWANKLQNAGYIVDTNPAVGSIAWWTNMGCEATTNGHVAFVDCVNGSVVTLSEYNYSPKCKYHTRTVDMSLPCQAGNRIPENFIHTEIGGLGGVTLIDILKQDDLYSIYPNPSNGEIKINSPKLLTNASVNIFNITGQIILHREQLSGDHFTFNISNNANGIYFVEIKENGKSSRLKIIKG